MSVLLPLVVGALAAVLASGDAFSFLAPHVRLTPAERRDLDRGVIVARTLKGEDGQVGALAISRIDVTPDALIAHARAIESLRRTSFVTGSKRLSSPPRIEDLDGLVLSPRDQQAAVDCAVGQCSFKLTASEIGLLRSEIAAAGADRAAAIHTAFKRVLLARVNAYLAGGLGGLPTIANRSTPFCLDRVFSAILAATPLSGPPCATEWLRDSPNDTTSVESFLYWSQESYGAGKPVILVTHVGIMAPAAPGDPAIVLGKQVMATRYMTGGLSLMAITTDQATGARYLVYLNGTGVDLLGGFFGPLKRAALESRLRSELPEIMQRLRTRLERTAAVTR